MSSGAGPPSDSDKPWHTSGRRSANARNWRPSRPPVRIQFSGATSKKSMALLGASASAAKSPRRRPSPAPPMDAVTRTAASQRMPHDAKRAREGEKSRRYYSPSPHLPSPHLPSPHLPSQPGPFPLSPHLVSAALSSPHLPSAALSSPHLPSAALSSPHLPSAALSSPHLPSAALSSPHLPSAASAASSW